MADCPEDAADTAADKAKERLNIWGSVLTVLVGENSKPLIIHSVILSSSSRFFQNALKPAWSSSRPDPKTIDMSHRSEETFSTYIHWLYSKKIPTSDLRQITDCSFQALVEAYVLGEELVDSCFKNAVLESIIAVTIEKKHYPTGEDVNVIWSGTLPGSPARTLMVDFYAHRVLGNGDKYWRSSLQSCPKEFLVEVVLAEADLRAVLPLDKAPWRLEGHTYREDHDGTG